LPQVNTAGYRWLTIGYKTTTSAAIALLGFS
jgi:hypothetical protein